MKPNPSRLPDFLHPGGRGLFVRWCCLAAAAFAMSVGAASAEIPLPDHLVYGTIAVGGRAATRLDTDVFVEARRSVNGQVLASYRMGSSTAMGDYFYRLRISMGDGRVSSEPNSAQPGDVVIVSVRSTAGLHYQVSHPIVEPGAALRLDFGGGIDTDGDGVPNGWELDHLGTAQGSLATDTDGDGVSDHAEYTAGTRPSDSADAFRLATVIDGGKVQVSFRALESRGTGYEGRQRWYALESATATNPLRWQSVENHSRIQGADQLVTYSQEIGGTNSHGFFRARVWLEGP
jgi:hypothetical protein